MTRTIARLSAALLTTALVAVAAPASAHVGVWSTDAAQEGYGKAVFRVPNESDTATTTKLVVTLPADTPFAFVSVGTTPGWTVDVAKAPLDQPAKAGDAELTEAVRTITWTADGDGIGVGRFEEFAISAGPFPDADSIAFTAEQTYSDGEVVAWDEPQQDGTEAEHPAPVLALPDGSGGHGQSAGSEDEADADTDDDADAPLGAWLGGAALVVACAALVVALRQNRRRA
jgi:uncharacterized protein YcnI